MPRGPTRSWRRLTQFLGNLLSSLCSSELNSPLLGHTEILGDSGCAIIWGSLQGVVLDSKEQKVNLGTASALDPQSCPGESHFLCGSRACARGSCLVVTLPHPAAQPLGSREPMITGL